MLTTDRSRRLFKEGSWIFFGQILMVMGSLAGVRLLTELLPPDAYGELALGMTIATLVNQIILGPLGGGIIRFYAPAVEQGDLGGYLNAVKKLVLYATGIIILLAVLAVVGLMIAGQTQWAAITTSALVFAILSGYSANLSGVQMAARQRAIVALHQGIDPLLRSLVAAGLLLWLGMSSTVAMLGYAIAALLILGSQTYFFQRILRGKTYSEDKKDWQKDIWIFSWPIGVFGIFTWFQLASDRWALQFFASTSDVGSYAVLYQLGYYPISLLTGMAMQFLVPILYQRAGDAKDSKRNADANQLGWRVTWISLALTGVAFLVATLLHAPIFHLLVAEEYRSVSYLMPWIIVPGGVFASGQTLALNLQAQMKTRELMTAKIVTAFFGVALNFAGAYWYGITGIICAGLMFSALYFAWMVILVNNGVKKECFC
jgi:O-antigen/teichoic acid export membrane protein